MLTSLQSPTQLNTLQTLVCGALSGSTAAFFTTPFDVVKTRLQTQIPGSLSRYNNVYHALQDIWMHEGLNGLYRGLIPRLVMYTTQGALFFASYESFKQLLSLEGPLLTAHEQEKENKDDSTSQLPSSSPARTASSPSRLHSLTGLYGGVGSNIVSSAPISALYAFSYESVEGTLLPLFPKESVGGDYEKGWAAFTLHWLVCGSLAASTAALFTTPFDVVKTRLQTQIPGSLSRYNICAPCPSRHGGFE
ncbi:hypothetical protein Golob_027951, partial [Gossypium lobatum]|nr:hypothetical protein [Gossypium lobatum]